MEQQTLGIVQHYGKPTCHFWQLQGERTVFVRRDVGGLAHLERSEYGKDDQQRHDLPFYAPYVAQYRIYTEDGSDLARYTVAVTSGSRITYSRVDCVTWKERQGKTAEDAEGYGLAPLDAVVLKDALALALKKG
jgi:hypothetical protein